MLDPDPPRFRLEDHRAGVRERYAPLAGDPSSRYHYHIGRHLAERLGYPKEELDVVPQEATSRFCGMGRPLADGQLEPGSTILDVGCGSGTDTFVAARRSGSTGRVVGVDMVPEMVDLASVAAARAGIDNVDFIAGLAEELPLGDQSVDVVITNGVLHLCPDKQLVLSELRRVLRPGGSVFGADTLIERIPPRSTRDLIFRWTKCVVGAFTPDTLRAALKVAGFDEIQLRSPIDVFDGARGEANADHYGANGWTFSARRPEAEFVLIK